tara:strand:+ start:1441 stop:1629 length:189 start_codon:yes stop_codon:yes gene_type:complete
MTINYKLIKDPIDNDIRCVEQTSTDSNVRLCIPFVEDNIDYQEYLKWVAEGNTAEPADEKQS